LISVDDTKGKRRSHRVDSKVGGLFDSKERKRFYQVLFYDNVS